jgi:hypothetical protein
MIIDERLRSNSNCLEVGYSQINRGAIGLFVLDLWGTIDHLGEMTIDYLKKMTIAHFG